MDDIKYGDILMPGDPDTREKQSEKVRKGFWPAFKRAVRVLPFGEDVVAAYYCVLDPTTPTRVRGILLAALAYFVSPIDFVPDFIAVIGFSDDLAVLTMAITSVRAHMKPEHYDKARDALEDHKTS
ncbi:YkvA family protein [Rhizobium sp. C4]|uniref:YkvA family protein n=1 Tax=Rhizobium sp. C4 TaxID=1349800 RepID=UPI001E4E9740|nr:YkvA family protein [Rhizobium sp. C4]MCD2174522.1 DUF1232 domain-containing protein [Rhizobium sp. C4]